MNPNLNVQPTLTNLQVELLKLFALQLPEEQLRELRFVIARFLMEKVNNQVDKISEERKYDAKTYEKWMSGEL